ncbi:MAG: Potassium-transporting ATPase chain, partial [Firmicutes bacterium]|nr:Potassium-transporting ATPase chain [Bacillota bacterium]
MINDFIVFIVFFILLILLALPLGKYMAIVFAGGKTWADVLLRPIEKTIYCLTGVNETEEMTWKEYALNLVIFNLVGIAAVFLIQVVQHFLPYNPENLPNISPWHLAFNTAVSFVTNTNWQAYAGENTMSYFT